MPHTVDSEPASLHVPDPLIAEAFKRSMHHHLLNCLDPEIMPWYWHICSDRHQFGDNTIWPGLDGHQIGHALMWAGHLSENLGFWEYVKNEQLNNGQIPYRLESNENVVPPYGLVGATLSFVGRAKFISSYFPGPSLFTLGASTWIKHGYDLFRFTQDLDWLEQNFDSIDSAAVWMTTMADEDGLVGCGSYYQDLPTRAEFDGITQGYAYQNYLQVTELAQRLGRDDRATFFQTESDRLRKAFTNRYWLGERCAEYIHPHRGPIGTHGLTDVDWIAQAVNLVDDEKDTVLWQQLVRSTDLYYGIMPTGPCANPENYEWRETMSKYHMHRLGSNSRFFYELAAMGRVWFIESMARHRRGDGDGLVDTLRRVATVGERQGWTWSERYQRTDLPPCPAREDQEHHRSLLAAHGDYGQPVKYDDLGCYAVGPVNYMEWPANLVRIACQWLAGVDLPIDGSLALSPCAPQSYYDAGFGLDATLLGRRTEVRYHHKTVNLTVEPGGPWRVRWRRPPWKDVAASRIVGRVNDRPLAVSESDGWLAWQLPDSDQKLQCTVDL